MLRKTLVTLSVLAALLIFPNHETVALERLIKGAPAQVGALPTPRETPDGPLTVIDVIVDRTAANAVLAREQAIAEAQRLAFQKLAERNLTPDAYKTFKVPDIKTIAGLVQDFEIKGERLSSTRYVANFTVRFRDAVRSYVPISAAVAEQGTAMEAIEGTDAGEETVKAPEDEDAPAADVANAPGEMAKTYLILPYIETMSKKLLLWEDPNPWREVWQKNMPQDAANGSSYIVPMGDISDVASGSTDAVWAGDYRSVEKLRQSYRVDEVLLAVANKSGAYMTVDMYFFRNGGLLKREVLQPYVGDRTEDEAYAYARAEVMRYLQAPSRYKGRRTVEAISRELTSRTASTPVVSAPVTTVPAPASTPVTVSPTSPVSSATALEGMMSFQTPSAWMELQKRLSSLTPPVRIEIRSISKTGAQFVMHYNGDVNALQQALASKGIALNQPAAAASGMKPVYGLQLMN